MSATASAGRVGRFYTAARRHPWVLGKVADWKIPLGPYTPAQIAVAVGGGFLLVKTISWWSWMGPIPIAAWLLSIWAVRRPKIRGRALLPAALGWALLLWQPQGGRIGGRAARDRAPHPLMGGFTIEDAPAQAPAAAPPLRCGRGSTGCRTRTTLFQGRFGGTTPLMRFLAAPQMLSSRVARAGPTPPRSATTRVSAKPWVRYGTSDSPHRSDGNSTVNSPRDAAAPPFRLAVTGGGTGGHTYPALTAVRALRDRLSMSGRALEVLWIGTESGLEARVAPAEGIPFTTVATGKIRRSANPLKMLSAANVKDMARVPLGVVQARKVITEFRPDVVLATGGYVAVPAGLAARMCGRPLVLHEQTVRLGLANRKLAGSATRIAVSSESTLPLLSEEARSIAVVTGNPVRPQVFSGQGQKAIEALGLRSFDGRRPTVYVTGGAQGSQQINETVAEVLPWLLEYANVVHQCGPDHVEALRQRAAALPAEAVGRYYVSGFVGTELPDVLALADVVISRSGAGTLAELTALGKAAVFIPLATSAGNEQAYNARHLQEAGAAVALEGEVTAQRMQDALGPLLADARLRQAMAERARAHGRPDAAERLVDVILSAAEGSTAGAGKHRAR